jgi:hypothetical protein
MYSFFRAALIEIIYVYFSTDYKLRILYRYFKVASSLFKNSLTSPEAALYKLNIIEMFYLLTAIHRLKSLAP